MNKESLKEYLSSRYQGWNSFLKNIIFPIFGEDDFEDGYETELLDSQPERRHLAEATGIRSIKQVGKMYVGVEPLQIFDVTVSDRVMMERNRVNIQRLIRIVMDQYSCAFMLFHYEDDTRWDWRFTYCRKSGNQEESTNSKRYTFLLGPGQSCRTAAENFMKLYDKREYLEVSHIEDAFSVEKLSNEFFDKYKYFYDKFVLYITGKIYERQDNKWVEVTRHQPHHFLFEMFDRSDKLVRDYVKKLLGRIVFLHFLQKKGWLGVPQGEDWGKGDHDFMLNLFQNATNLQKAHYLDTVLEPLFSNALDHDRRKYDDLFDTGVKGFRNKRFPYLNGGLFECDKMDSKPINFPADYFQDFLNMLSQYNFTIDENDPNDAEVGVDPEMLGRIFENLLEDNKDKGAFYTPKNIVQYMCRESLITYLQSNQKEKDKAPIRQFVINHDADVLGVLKDDIERKLCEVKICDPAIGSGAFPMGLLRELFFCRTAINPSIMDKAADVKRHIIQNNIYGVDIEHGAVEIARLRFWLSLIVDEKTPNTLPNLDFKIVEGNSLITTFNDRHVNLSEGQKHINARAIEIKKRNLIQLQEQYYAAIGEDKIKLLVDIKTTILDIVELQLSYERQSWLLKSYRTGELFSELSSSGMLTEKEAAKKMSPEKATIIELCNNLKAKLRNSSISLKERSETNILFFDWHIIFSDVFSRPSKRGFDIVIGNPPWGADLSKDSKALLKTVYSEIDSSTPNSYAYFIGWGLKNYLSSLMFVLPDSILIKDFKKTRELISSNVREVLWYQNCEVPRERRIFRDVEHDVCIIGLDKSNHSSVHFQTNNYEENHYIPKDNIVEKKTVFKDEFDYVFNLKASPTEWAIASKLLIHQPLSTIAQCHEGIHSGNIRDKLFVTDYQPGLKPLFFGGRAGDIIMPYVSYRAGWYVDYRQSIINIEAGEYASLRDERLFVLPKIYVTRTGNPFKAFYDEGSYASNNFFSLQIKDYKNNTKDNLLFILPFINSKVCQFFIRKFAAPRLGNAFIETKIIHLLKFPIPKVSLSKKNMIIELVKEIIKVKQANLFADTIELENRINNEIYMLYGLTMEEIKLIEQ